MSDNKNMDSDHQILNDDGETIHIRPRAAVPVWKAGSTPKNKPSKSPSPKPIDSDKKTIKRSTTNESDDFIEGQTSISSSSDADYDARILSEKNVRKSYFSDIFSFFRNFIPNSISESRLRVFNFILAALALLLIIIIFISIVVK